MLMRSRRRRRRRGIESRRRQKKRTFIDSGEQRQTPLISPEMLSFVSAWLTLIRLSSVEGTQKCKKGSRAHASKSARIFHAEKRSTKTPKKDFNWWHFPKGFLGTKMFPSPTLRNVQPFSIHIEARENKKKYTRKWLEVSKWTLTVKKGRKFPLARELETSPSEFEGALGRCVFFSCSYKRINNKAGLWQAGRRAVVSRRILRLFERILHLLNI